MLNEFCNYLSNVLNINIVYIYLVIRSLIIIILANIIRYIGKCIINSTIKNNKRNYNCIQQFKLIIIIVELIIMFFVWDEYIKNVMTLVSVLSGTALLALKEFILNLFCGIYIRFKHVFKVEDRIVVNNIKGDVINISAFQFEVLEVDEDINNGQSTGVVITLPNSVIFNYSIKNYTKGFKYIWNELVINLDLDCDLDNNKKEIYKIINNIEELKYVKDKMQEQIDNVDEDYRIYYNNYDPIIYTRVVDNYIELRLRYLVNPKKARNIENTIWFLILKSYKKHEINLNRLTN